MRVRPGVPRGPGSTPHVSAPRSAGSIERPVCRQSSARSFLAGVRLLRQDRCRPRSICSGQGLGREPPQPPAGAGPSARFYERAHVAQLPPGTIEKLFFLRSHFFGLLSAASTASASLLRFGISFASSIYSSPASLACPVGQEL